MKTQTIPSLLPGALSSRTSLAGFLHPVPATTTGGGGGRGGGGSGGGGRGGGGGGMNERGQVSEKLKKV